MTSLAQWDVSEISLGHHLTDLLLANDNHGSIDKILSILPPMLYQTQSCQEWGSHNAIHDDFRCN